MQALAKALGHNSYRLLVIGFFVCGFHVALIMTHLPAYAVSCGLPAMTGATALSLIGLFNLVGTNVAGALGDRYRKKYLLSGIYAARSVVIALYLVLPVTALSTQVFAAAMGLLWLSTVPLTSGLVGQIFGPQYMAMLYGSWPLEQAPAQIRSRRVLRRASTSSGSTVRTEAAVFRASLPPERAATFADLVAWRPDVLHSHTEFSAFWWARRLAHRLGAALPAAMDVGAACNGFIAALDGSCKTPIAAHGIYDAAAGKLTLEGALATENGEMLWHAAVTKPLQPKDYETAAAIGLRSAEDLLRNDIIQRLMCHGTLDIRDIEDKFDIDFATHFADALARLAPLQADGLVEVDAGHITATARGRLLMRIIAMCFDAYLGQPTAAPARYSKAI